MILYRALNKDNVDGLNKGENIGCSLYNNFVKLQKDKAEIIEKMKKTQSKNVKKKYFRKMTNTEQNAYIYYYDSLHLKSVVAESLDLIIGHVSGAKLKSGISPWISTSTDLPFAISEYGVPQAGNYNTEKERKPIAIIDYDDSKVYSTVDRLKEIRNKVNNFDFAVDLRDDRLRKYYDSDVVMAEQDNFNLIGGGLNSKRIFGYKSEVKGFSTYATRASEVLIHGVIRKDNVTKILYPLFQDIIYSSNLDVTKNLKDIIEKQDDINSIMESKLAKKTEYQELYPDISKGTNLTDFLIRNYSSIEGATTEDKYRNAMIMKLALLREIICDLKENNILDISDPTRILDTGLHFNSYSYLTKLTQSQTKKKMQCYMNDLIAIERDGTFYVYDAKNKGYVSTKNDSDVISKKDILSLKLR